MPHDLCIGFSSRLQYGQSMEDVRSHHVHAVMNNEANLESFLTPLDT